ncbi:MAG: hypothetical protein AAGF28_06985 [Pseudomonadota bacterium]
MIDYVEFTLTTVREQSWYDVQKTVVESCGLKDKPWVVGPNAEEDYRGIEFRIRVQDPDVFSLAQRVRSVAARFLGKITVRELEVSVDFKPHDHTDETGQLMVGLMTLHYLPKDGMVKNEDDSMRCVKETKGTAKGWTKRNVDWLDQRFVAPRDGSRRLYRDRLESYIKVDRTMRVGNEKADEQIRIRHKESNKRSGKSAFKLPHKERRARIEATLSGKALADLGIVKPEDLVSFDYLKLRKPYFDFALHTLPAYNGFRKPQVLDQMKAWQENQMLEVFLKIGVSACHRDMQRIVHRESFVRRKLKADGGLVHSLPPSRRHRGGRMNTLMSYTELHEPIETALSYLKIKSSKPQPPAPV